MNILGHEIDVSFVYQVMPIKVVGGSDFYYYVFELSFKDGKNHSVEIGYNNTSCRHNGHTFYCRKEQLTARQRAALPGKLKKAGVQITELRNNIIKAMALRA